MTPPSKTMSVVPIDAATVQRLSWWALLRGDVRCVLERDPAARNRIEVWTIYPGVQAIALHRVAHVLWRRGWRYAPRAMSFFARWLTQIDIHPGASIGARFFIDHGTGVVIGETCQIGNYVKIYQGVTLGALSFPTDAAGQLIRGRKRHPTIEDRVVIYANATLLGGETVIGHDSVIGSSVWLTGSVDPYAIVTMEKPRLRIRPSWEIRNVLDYQI